ncbi:hypothetical protein GDO86_008163 [Hymenochirus boettgeri]|uniref:Ribonuclease P protein subunit p29 n=1 Tax=Hymenochirus boettgeri TaxID=247094 RepID=A0A8T2J4M4_9PIPI|nr:hypothetical protein GDO86_008163 [Hymenochirus boettgeri]
MDIIYKPLPPEEAQQLGLQLQDPRKAVSFVNAFLKHSMPNVKKSLQENLERKAVVLEYSYKKKKKKSNKSKVLTAKERREMRIFEIKPEQQKQPQMIQNKLLKADLHGALVVVTKSKCPSYVGLQGIILQETKHVFKIVTKEDKLKIVPKLNCVFSLEIDGFISYIYGSKFQMRASERSAKKFKGKGSIDL